MMQELEFRYTLPRFPQGRPVTADEAEALLLERATAGGDTAREAHHDLAELYAQTGRHDQAERCVRQLLERAGEPGEVARCLMHLGQLAEKRDDYQSAAGHYRQGLEVGPDDPRTAYFLRNNLAFSLNQLERHAEAEPLLREAIRIGPEVPNAHKNLGLCLWGLGRHVEAAGCFIDATRVNAADGRSLQHLEQLAARHPEIARSIPDFDSLVQACRQAVAEADRHRPDFGAWWRRARAQDATP